MSRNIDIDDDLQNDGFEDGRGAFTGGPKRKIQGLKAFVALMLIMCLGFLGWFGYEQYQRMNKPPEKKEPAAQTGANSLRAYKFDSEPADNEAPRTADNATTAASAPSGNGSNTGGTNNGKTELTPEQKAMQRRLGKGFTQDNLTVAAGAATGEGARRPQTSESSSALSNSLNSSRRARVKASMLLNPSLTVPQGKMIRCGTTAELDTTVPGMVSCLVSADVMSADNKVVLINKGAQVVGEVSGGIKDGQARVFVLWTRLRNPDQAYVYLDSPGTNRLGSAGVPGQVNSHFWERYGPALMLSVLSDGGSALIQSAANSGNSTNTNINLDNTSSTGDSMGREALKATLSIPPTLYAPQGDAVSIYVARDVDFSDVYALEMNR
ncbi:type IV secretion system protein VirB10 [Pseudomonas corrugata]|uniref:type IV secretion system protein VirB10 n=1 Tax=Pseudomonas corrugata TaxID=47879 RepID=UPI0028C47B61|nr:type IV secretion system protein VirB10 [Pseudomonas corrugata]MDU9042797.1 type IV secretion system protein VirB10 [Pseudomonas corrugata]